MDSKLFLKTIQQMSCYNCPISGFCRGHGYTTCTRTALAFFSKYQKGGKIQWPDIKSLDLADPATPPTLSGRKNIL